MWEGFRRGTFKMDSNIKVHRENMAGLDTWSVWHEEKESSNNDFKVWAWANNAYYI
jgi:hypothetical protein